MNKNMKILTLLLVILSIGICVIAGMMQFTTNKAPLPYATIILFAISILSVIISVIALITNGTGSAQNAQPEPIKEPEKIVTPKITTPKSSNDQAILLLTLLQEKGRLLDFLMEDVSTYSDEEIAGAARVIHQGCKDVVKDCFNPEAVCTDEESTKITLEEGYAVSDYKIVGNIDGTAPYSGTLVHKGWKAGKINLPVLNKTYEGIEKPVIIPAEIEIQ